MAPFITAVHDETGEAGPLTSFELLASKLKAPRHVRGTVQRSRLVAQLESSATRPIVAVCAGAGYGKTTALAQWASVAARPFAWVTVEPSDNDPVVLLSYIAAAIDAAIGIDAGVYAALASPGASVQTKAVPRLGTALAQAQQPFVLVLDDVHTITSPPCIDALVALADNLAEGSQLVLSARDPGLLPLARWRTRGLLAEVTSEDLRMDGDEARTLLHSAEPAFSDENVDALVDRTEGWPAGLYLAGLSAAADGAVGQGVTGNDPHVFDFLRSELVSSLPAEELRFLTQTSVLERMSGPLCDAALQRTGSAEMLESLQRSNRFVVALDRDRVWYRSHKLLRDLLVTEFERTSPQEVSAVRDRAFAWSLEHGDHVEAIAYAQAAGDPDRVAWAVERLALPVFQSGRVATVAQWFAWMREHGRRPYPAVAVIAGISCAIGGQSIEAERWAEQADAGAYDGPLPDGSASIESWRAMLRALRAQDGLERMRSDADLAVRSLGPQSPWRPMATLLLGIAETLAGDVERADDHFADSIEISRGITATTTPLIVPITHAERSIGAMGRQQWSVAADLAEQAVAAVRRTRNPEAMLHGIAYAAAARSAVHTRRHDHARELLIEAQRRLPGLTHACPVLAVQTRLQMAHAYVGLADRGGTHTVLGEIDDIRRRVPDLGGLYDEAQRLKAALSAPGRELPGASSLTAAELRILPLLTTHLSHREMGERQFLSHHTIKSHSLAIYRKLGVTSRSEAVTRAQEIGLL